MRKITFCEQNIPMGTQYVIDYLNNHHADKIEIRMSRCLGECGECFSNCIADFHGKLLVAKSPEELLEDILERIE